MPSAATLPLIAALAMTGAAAGVALGRSAGGEIDPAYHQDADSVFYADKVPNRSPDWATVQAQEYQEAQVVTQDAPKPAGCVGCSSWPVDYVPRRDPTVDRLYASTGYDREYRQAAREAQAAIAVEEVPAPARERIVRYASYPVSREEADAAAAEAAAAAQASAEEDAATQ
jgi:hypothetical protein